MKQLTSPLELKALDEYGRFAGYASLFGNVDNQQDVMQRGAFAEILQQKLPSEIKLLWQHQMHEPIGQIEELFEDERGLYMEGRLLLSVQRGREAYDLMKIGALKGLSIGYRPVKYDIDAQSGVRLLQQVELFEISVVTFPANVQAGVTVVKAQENIVPSQLVSLSDALYHACRVLG